MEVIVLTVAWFTRFWADSEESLFRAVLLKVTVRIKMKKYAKGIFIDNLLGNLKKYFFKWNPPKFYVARQEASSVIFIPAGDLPDGENSSIHFGKTVVIHWSAAPAVRLLRRSACFSAIRPRRIEAAQPGWIWNPEACFLRKRTALDRSIIGCLFSGPFINRLVVQVSTNVWQPFW